MKFYHLWLLIILVLFGARVSAEPIIMPRSQSVNAARELVGWQQYINRGLMDGVYGAFSATAEYEQSFNTTRLLKCLFDGDLFFTSPINSSCRKKSAQLLIQGSRAANRQQQAWLADYFGLPPDFSSVVSMKPSIKNALIDFNIYVGLDEWAPGWFFRAHTPLVWAKWQLCLAEDVLSTGTLGFDVGYMNSSGVPHNQLRTSFLSAADGSYVWGDMLTPLAFGRFCSTNSCETKPRVSFADVELAMGYNFCACEDYHFGLELRGSGPLGNKPCLTCLFEPIIGNGYFWTLGGGITAHTVVWQSESCPERSLSFYFDANVVHMFKSCQLRSFDLKGKPNSRYMLIEQFGNPVAVNGNFLFAGTTQANATKIPLQYEVDNLLALINVTTFNTDVSYAVQADIVFKFSYNTEHWDIDLGYEWWVRSAEKICLRSNSFDERKFVLKGDAFIYGFGASNAVATGLANAAVPLSASENNATIHSGTNTPISTPFSVAQTQNLFIDAAIPAWGASGTTVANPTDTLQIAPNTPSNSATQQNTSNPALFISTADLNTCSNGGTCTNKIFGHVSYTWQCWEDYAPFIGIGGEAEFAPCGKNGKCSQNSDDIFACNTCNCAISQWGIWLKGGIAFE